VVEIIQRCRPPEPINDEISFVAWFAVWLALGEHYAMPAPWIREQALELTLEERIRR
jgi:SH3-like domain-containing protein